MEFEFGFDGKFEFYSFENRKTIFGLYFFGGTELKNFVKKIKNLLEFIFLFDFKTKNFMNHKFLFYFHATKILLSNIKKNRK